MYYERNKYTVTYNANSGNVTPASANGYHGATITLPTPSRTGYTFNGWYTQATGGTKYNTTMAIPVNGATVYADWTPQGLIEKAVSVGQEVTVGGENFYVIEDSPASSDQVILLSKYNLNSDGSKQDPTGQFGCAFSSSQYWSGNNEDLNISHIDATAYNKAKIYGTTKGGRGRLITHVEAETLKSTMTDQLYGNNIGAPDNYLRFWEGTSHVTGGEQGKVWAVAGSSGFGVYSYGYTSNGVRAVLEISKHLVSL